MNSTRHISISSKHVLAVLVLVSFLAVLFFSFPAIMGLFAWGNAARGRTAAQGIPGANGQKSVLVAPEVLYDFGTISMKNGNVTKEFIATNPTKGDITLKTLVTSCMCTKAFIVRADRSLKGPFGMPGMGYVPPANELIKAGASITIR